MFGLTTSIENWKQNLSINNSFTNSDIEELESHLLEEIDLLKQKQLTDEEAFYVASSRLGSIELLSSEFIKINTSSIYLKRVAWFLGGYIIISFILQLINAFSLFSTNYVYNMNILYVQKFPYLSLFISVVIAAVFFYFLFTPKYNLLSKLQSIFNYLFTYKKLLLILLLSVFIIIDSIGYLAFQYFFTLHTPFENYGQMTFGNGIFSITWSIVLCLIFILLSFRKSKN